MNILTFGRISDMIQEKEKQELEKKFCKDVEDKYKIDRVENTNPELVKHIMEIEKKSVKLRRRKARQYLE